MNRLIAALAMLFCLSGPAAAADKLSPDQVRDLTTKAAHLLVEKGVDAAHHAFLTEGPFRQGEIYVNVIDTNGTWVVYPPNPHNEGKSVLNVRDADGKLLVQDIIKIALQQGEGWVEYSWLNPETNQIQRKMSYVKYVPELGLITYAGLYK